jgi:2-keto-4-pentenoate hydratase/2-oxohepta-3-ene-1,7-dioic acid hydratase in catechol pathway
MRLVRFQRYRYRALGVWRDDGQILDLSAAAAAWLDIEQGDPFWEREVALRLPADVGKFLAGGGPSRALAQAAFAFAAREPTPRGIEGEPLLVDANDVHLLAPLIAPLILSAGATFPGRERHREFFMRNPLNVLGPGDDVSLPARLSEDFDLAPRLAVIIGAPLRNAARGQAEAAIYGFCAALDICARDLQTISWAGPMFHVQYPHARAFDGSLMLGACVVSKDDADSIAAQTARLDIDGTRVFDGVVAGSWDTLVEWICHLSETVTLEPGTLLLPGSGDEIVVRTAASGGALLEIVNLAPSRHALLRPGAAVTLDMPGVGRITTRIGGSVKP